MNHFTIFRMEDSDECPICFHSYGTQPDESFLCRDGIDNSNFESACKHYICVTCVYELSKQDEVRCPMCREDWTDWVNSHYCNSTTEDEDEESDDEETTMTEPEE